MATRVGEICRRLFYIKRISLACILLILLYHSIQSKVYPVLVSVHLKFTDLNEISLMSRSMFYSFC